MSPWWTEATGTLIGAFGGAGYGSLAGMFGGLSGALAARGKARTPVIATHIGFLTVGVVCLAGGLVAVATGQPYHVWYPLVLIGGIGSVLFGALLPQLKQRYAAAEQRTVEAETIRRG